jgi:hypothetical protein
MKRAHREPFEHTVDTPTKFDRALFVPDTYKAGEPSRLRVMHDEDHGLTWIADEPVTSESATARPLDTDNGRGFDITEQEVRWLHRTLGELIAWLEKRQSEPERTIDDLPKGIIT